jgi:hypothetical protein
MKMERDWKTLRKMIPVLRERYLKEKNIEIKKLLDDKNKNETERFWDARYKIEEERKILIDCLDGHSRSNMSLHMNLMYKYGMLKDEDLNEFSDELKNQIKDMSKNI